MSNNTRANTLLTIFAITTAGTIGAALLYQPSPEPPSLAEVQAMKAECGMYGYAVQVVPNAFKQVAFVYCIDEDGNKIQVARPKVAQAPEQKWNLWGVH